MSKPILSIIVLSFNTKKLLEGCLLSLEKLKKELVFEVIVSDNNSSDGSPEMVEISFPWVKLIKSRSNLGFAGGNNLAKTKVKGDLVLFLNSDTVVDKNVLNETVEYITNNKLIGALTCKIVLPDGSLDKDARRSFITPWVGFTHLVLGLDKFFPRSKLFGRYWYGYEPEDRIHEVDVIQGAFFLTRKKLLDEIGWLDEKYFLDGEDVDLCWRIKQLGYKIVYYPNVKILHYKGASKGKINSSNKKNIPLKERLRYRMAGVNSMDRFYRKWLWQKYPLLLNIIVLTGIRYIKVKRYLQTVISG